MRIGILTLPLHTNYGGILQAYALQTVLERIGHEVEIINVPFTLPSISKVTIVKRIIKKILGKYPGYINYEGKFNKWLPIVAQNLQSFKDKYIHMSHIYDDYSAISSNDYDCIVVGSDQIWRPRMLLSDISNAYLSFAEGWNIKRIAYSASFGTQNWEYTSVQTEKCKKLLKMFDAVSVREDSGVVNCLKYFGVKAVHTLDPTLLLTKNDYNELIKIVSPTCNHQVFAYILDMNSEKQQMVKEFSNKNNYEIRTVNPELNNIKCDLNKRIVPSVEEWLIAFRDSDFIITDSFHACVFSILYQKPFAVIVNNERGSSRFLSLLSMFGLTDRMVNCLNDIESLEEIDYIQVYDKLALYREKSFSYFKENL